MRLRLEPPGREHPLFEKLRQATPFGTLVVFGSLADGTETGFSDVDLLWVYPEGSDPKVVRRTLTRLSKITLLWDHLQHHPPFHASLGELARSSPLPPGALKPAAVLKGEPEITLGGWGRGRDVLERLAGSVIRRSRERPRNLYELKSFLSWLFLLPALAFRAQGVDLPKPEAIAKAGEISPKAWVLEPASRLRAQWPRPESALFKLAISLAPDPWPVSRRLARRLFKIPNWMKGFLTEEFWDGARSFAEDCLRAAG